MLTSYVDEQNHIIEVTIAQKINRKELNDLINSIQAPFEDWQDIKVLKRVDSITGMEPMALVDDLKFAFENFKHLKKVTKTAVVTDKDWIKNLSELFKKMIPMQVRIFETEDIEKAREWLRSEA